MNVGEDSADDRRRPYVGVRGWLRSTGTIWPEGTSTTMKWVLGSSVLAGIAAVAAGVVGDVRHWWDDFPFLTNFLTGLTGALFGVPFAFVVVDGITRRNADAAERRTVIRLMIMATDALLGPAARLRRAGQTDAGHLIDLQFRLRPAVAAVQRLSENHGDEQVAARPSAPGSGLQERREFRTAARDLLVSLAELHSALERALPPSPIIVDEAWSELCLRWRFVNDYIRPRTFDLAVPWLEDDLVSRCEQYLRADKPPMTRLFELRDRRLAGYAETLQQADDATFGPSNTYNRRRAAAEGAALDVVDALEACSDEVDALLAVHEALGRVAKATAGFRRRSRQSRPGAPPPTAPSTTCTELSPSER